MDALTPAWRFFVSSLRLPSPRQGRPPSRTMNAGLFQTGLFVSCVSPSNHSHSNHPTTSRHRFHTLPFSVTGIRFTDLGFAIY